MTKTTERVIVRVISSIHCIIEEWEPNRPYTLRTFVERIENVYTKRKYLEAWRKFLGTDQG